MCKDLYVCIVATKSFDFLPFFILNCPLYKQLSSQLPDSAALGNHVREEELECVEKQ